MDEQEHDENGEEAEYDKTSQGLSKLESHTPKTVETKTTRHYEPTEDCRKKSREVEVEKAENLNSDQNIHSPSDEANICDDSLEELKRPDAASGSTKPVSQCIWR